MYPELICNLAVAQVTLSFPSEDVGVVALMCTRKASEASCCRMLFGPAAALTHGTREE